MAAIVVDAAVVEPERPTIVAATKLLADVLAEAGAHPGVELRFREGLAGLDPAHAPTIAIASLQLELMRDDETLAATEARWRERLVALSAVPMVVFCTILRHAATPLPARPNGATSQIERIRRLDRMAIELAHETGARVADVDRVVAHVGARRLATDHRLGNAAVAEVAAWTIVRVVLAGGLDDVVAPVVQERARASLGELWELPKFVARRLGRR